MNNVISFLNMVAPMEPALQQHLGAILKATDLHKKDYLLKPGQVCENIYFIQAGLLRCYYLENELEITSWFMGEGDVIISVDSFFSQAPSYEIIQALEPTTLYYITHEELQQIYAQFPIFNYHGRILTEQYYRQLWQYTYFTKMKRAAERYQYFTQHFPKIIDRVPGKYLASYLGITPETLSRIRHGRKN